MSHLEMMMILYGLLNATFMISGIYDLKVHHQRLKHYRSEGGNKPSGYRKSSGVSSLRLGLAGFFVMSLFIIKNPTLFG